MHLRANGLALMDPIVDLSIGVPPRNLLESKKTGLDESIVGQRSLRLMVEVLFPFLRCSSLPAKKDDPGLFRTLCRFPAIL